MHTTDTELARDAFQRDDHCREEDAQELIVYISPAEKLKIAFKLHQVTCLFTFVVAPFLPSIRDYNVFV